MTVVTFIICLAPIIANTTQGLISVDENLIDLFVMYKASRRRFFQAPAAQCVAEFIYGHSHFCGH